MKQHELKGYVIVNKQGKLYAGKWPHDGFNTFEEIQRYGITLKTYKSIKQAQNKINNHKDWYKGCKIKSATITIKIN